MYTQKKEQGGRPNKRTKAIKMNDSRAQCLSMHILIGIINYCKKNSYQYYRARKYFCKGNLYKKLINCTVAYNTCNECAEGITEEGWFVSVKDRLGQQEFHDNLTIQQLEHKLKNNLCPRDSKFKDSTGQHKRRRRLCNINEIALVASTSTLSIQQENVHILIGKYH